MFLTVIHPTAEVRRPRRRARGCFVGCLTTLLLLVVLGGALWFAVLRPYLHTIAETQLDHAMNSAVNQIPAQAAALPPGSTLQIKEASITNLIALNLAPSNPVKNPQTTITKQAVQITFQLYGNPCTIAAVPQISHGRLVVGDVRVDGIVGLIMSPDEMTTLLNKHLADAQGRLQHNVTAVRLDNQAITMTLG